MKTAAESQAISNCRQRAPRWGQPLPTAPKLRLLNRATPCRGPPAEDRSACPVRIDRCDAAGIGRLSTRQRPESRAMLVPGRRSPDAHLTTRHATDQGDPYLQANRQPASRSATTWPHQDREHCSVPQRGGRRRALRSRTKLKSEIPGQSCCALPIVRLGKGAKTPRRVSGLATEGSPP
jgi:hypothetical protein